MSKKVLNLNLALNQQHIDFGEKLHRDPSKERFEDDEEIDIEIDNASGPNNDAFGFAASEGSVDLEIDEGDDQLDNIQDPEVLDYDGLDPDGLDPDVLDQESDGDNEFKQDFVFSKNILKIGLGEYKEDKLQPKEAKKKLFGAKLFKDESAEEKEFEKCWNFAAQDAYADDPQAQMSISESRSQSPDQQISIGMMEMILKYQNGGSHNSSLSKFEEMQCQLDLNALNLKSVGLSEQGSINPTPVELEDDHLQSIAKSSSQTSQFFDLPQKNGEEQLVQVQLTNKLANFESSNAASNQKLIFIAKDLDCERKPEKRDIKIKQSATPTESSQTSQEQLTSKNRQNQTEQPSADKSLRKTGNLDGTSGVVSLARALEDPSTEKPSREKERQFEAESELPESCAAQEEDNQYNTLMDKSGLNDVQTFAFKSKINFEFKENEDLQDQSRLENSRECSPGSHVGSQILGSDIESDQEAVPQDKHLQGEHGMSREQVDLKSAEQLEIIKQQQLQRKQQERVQERIQHAKKFQVGVQQARAKVSSFNPNYHSKPQFAQVPKTAQKVDGKSNEKKLKTKQPFLKKGARNPTSLSQPKGSETEQQQDCTQPKPFVPQPQKPLKTLHAYVRPEQSKTIQSKPEQSKATLLRKRSLQALHDKYKRPDMIEENDCKQRLDIEKERGQALHQKFTGQSRHEFDDNEASEKQLHALDKAEEYKALYFKQLERLEQQRNLQRRAMFSAAEVKQMQTFTNQEQVLQVQLSKLEGKLKNIKDQTPPQSRSRSAHTNRVGVVKQVTFGGVTSNKSVKNIKVLNQFQKAAHEQTAAQTISSYKQSRLLVAEQPTYKYFDTEGTDNEYDPLRYKPNTRRGSSVERHRFFESPSGSHSQDRSQEQPPKKGYMTIFEKRSASRSLKSPNSRKSSVKSINRPRENRTLSPINQTGTSSNRKGSREPASSQRRSPFRPQSELIRVETGQEQSFYPHFRNLSDHFIQPAHNQVNQTLPAVNESLSFVNTSNSGSDLKSVRERYRQIVSMVGQSYNETNNESTLSVSQYDRMRQAHEAQRELSSQLNANYESLGSSHYQMRFKNSLELQQLLQQVGSGSTTLQPDLLTAPLSGYHAVRIKQQKRTDEKPASFTYDRQKHISFSRDGFEQQQKKYEQPVSTQVIREPQKELVIQALEYNSGKNQLSEESRSPSLEHTFNPSPMGYVNPSRNSARPRIDTRPQSTEFSYQQATQRSSYTQRDILRGTSKVAKPEFIHIDIVNRQAQNEDEQSSPKNDFTPSVLQKLLADNKLTLPGQKQVSRPPRMHLKMKVNLTNVSNKRVQPPTIKQADGDLSVDSKPNAEMSMQQRDKGLQVDLDNKCYGSTVVKRPGSIIRSQSKQSEYKRDSKDFAVGRIVKRHDFAVNRHQTSRDESCCEEEGARNHDFAKIGNHVQSVQTGRNTAMSGVGVRRMSHNATSTNILKTEQSLVTIPTKRVLYNPSGIKETGPVRVASKLTTYNSSQTLIKPPKPFSKLGSKDVSKDVSKDFSKDFAEMREISSRDYVTRDLVRDHRLKLFDESLQQEIAEIDALLHGQTNAGPRDAGTRNAGTRDAGTRNAGTRDGYLNKEKQDQKVRQLMSQIAELEPLVEFERDVNRQQLQLIHQLSQKTKPGNY